MEIYSIFANRALKGQIGQIGLSEELLSLIAPYITDKTFVFVIRRESLREPKHIISAVCLTVFLP